MENGINFSGIDVLVTYSWGVCKKGGIVYRYKNIVVLQLNIFKTWYSPVIQYTCKFYYFKMHSLQFF